MQNYKFIPRKKRKIHPSAERLESTAVATIISTLLETAAPIRDSGSPEEATNKAERR